MKKKTKSNIRVCADFYTGLNECRLHHTYPLSLAEEIFSKLNGRCYFLKIDLSDEYFTN